MGFLRTYPLLLPHQGPARFRRQLSPQVPRWPFGKLLLTSLMGQEVCVCLNSPTADHAGFALRSPLTLTCSLPPGHPKSSARSHGLLLYLSFRSPTLTPRPRLLSCTIAVHTPARTNFSPPPRQMAGPRAGLPRTPRRCATKCLVGSLQRAHPQHPSPC